MSLIEVLDMKMRKMIHEDREAVLEMMRIFYASPAVLSNGSEEIFRADVENCVGGSPYLEGYVFEENGALCGYSMLAKSFSTEFGKPCIWIEDLYLQEQARGKGIGTAFLQMVAKMYPDAVLRLEAEEENHRAIATYHKNGFRILPYTELVKL